MSTTTRKQTGFTIVELLIVIVVIAILAAISVVAYTGIQQRARDTERSTEVSNVQRALEMYRIDNGSYPSVGGDDIGYNLSALSSALVPSYIGSLPTDPKPRHYANYQYVRGPVGGNSYGIYVDYETKSPCHIGANNVGLQYWGVQDC